MGARVDMGQPDCVLSISVPTFHKPLQELEIARSIHCFLFGEYLKISDGPDVHRKYHQHLKFEPTRHCRQIQFLCKASTFSGLIPFRLAGVRQSVTTVCSRRFFFIKFRELRDK